MVSQPSSLDKLPDSDLVRPSFCQNRERYTQGKTRDLNWTEKKSKLDKLDYEFSVIALFLDSVPRPSELGRRISASQLLGKKKY